MKFTDSFNFTISNLVFKAYDNQQRKNDENSIVILKNCFSCKVVNATFLNYGLSCTNLVGKSYLSNMVINYTVGEMGGINLFYYSRYSRYSPTSHHGKHMVVIDRILMHKGKAVTSILFDNAIIEMQFVISNSRFEHMQQGIFYVKSQSLGSNSTIWIKNCRFQYNGYQLYDIVMINAIILHYNMKLIFSNCLFDRNQVAYVISIQVSKAWSSEVPSPLSNITITKCTFFQNAG